jgi:hypothetical protein
VLVGTTSVEKSEQLSEMLAMEGIKHQVGGGTRGVWWEGGVFWGGGTLGMVWGGGGRGADGEGSGDARRQSLQPMTWWFFLLLAWLCVQCWIACDTTR